MTPDKTDDFFFKQLSSEESNEVARFLKEHPDVLNEYLNEKEWEQFKEIQNVSEEDKKRIWNRIYEKIHVEKRGIQKLRNRMFAAAASLILVIFVVWALVNKEEHMLPPVAQKIVSEKLIENKSGDTLGFYTPDGSIVYLLPKSSVTFSVPFEERSLKLNGEALFNIKQDSARPFVVHSGALSTTVLGTLFSVRTYEMEPLITVHLFEGKVVVRAAGAENDLQHFLRPGETLFYDKNEKTVSINLAAKNKVKPEKAGEADNLPEIKQKTLSEKHWYMFNNQPLAEVLKELSRLYEVKIVYDEDDIKGMTFIATLDKTDSLENILKSIASLNELKLEKESKKFILKKSQP